MPKTKTIHKKDCWKSIKKEKRAKYNPKWNKTRSEIIDTGTGKLKKGIDIEFDTSDPRFEHPKEVPLDQAVLFMEKGYGNDLKVVFRDDTSEEEINAITLMIESDLK